MTPVHTGGFNINTSYKNFDLGLYLTGVMVMKYTMPINWGHFMDTRKVVWCLRKQTFFGEGLL